MAAAGNGPSRPRQRGLCHADLARNPDVRAYVAALESWIIDVLDGFGISGQRRDGHPGIWITSHDRGQDRGHRCAHQPLGQLERLRSILT